VADEEVSIFTPTTSIHSLRQSDYSCSRVRGSCRSLPYV